MAALSSELVASYRDHRIGAGKSNNTVRIELALLSNLFTVAIQEWGLGLIQSCNDDSKAKPRKGARPPADVRRREAIAGNRRQPQQCYAGLDRQRLACASPKY